MGQRASTRGGRGPTRLLGQHKSGGLLAGLERWVWECTEGGPPRGAGVEVRKGASGELPGISRSCSLPWEDRYT